MGKKRKKKKPSVAPPKKNFSWKWHIVALLIIITAGIITYSNSIGGTFHFDDFHTIRDNPTIRTLNPTVVWKDNNHFRVTGFYSFALNHYFSGRNNLSGWHYVNIGLHIACALLLYAALTLIVADMDMKDSKLPAIASLLFVVHPVFSEPVNYIQARLVLFYTLFTLSGLTCAILFFKIKSLTGKVFSCAGIILSVVLGALSKEVGIFYVPAMIGLYLLIFKWRKTEKGKHLPNWAVITGIASAAVIFFLIAIYFFPVSKLFRIRYHSMLGEKVSYIKYLLTESKIFWKYLALMIPSSTKLNIDHYVDIVKLNTFTGIVTALIPLICIIASFALACWRMRKNPIFAFFIFWSLLGILPYLLLQSSAELMVEYKFYIAAIGVIGIIALGIDYIVTSFSRTFSPHYTYVITGIAFVFLIFICINKTRTRNEVWKDEISIWSDAVVKSPKKARPYNNLGSAYASAKNHDKAIELYNKAITIKPDYVEAYNNLANAYNATGQNKKAITILAKLIQKKPNNAETFNSLGNSFAAIGNNKAAIDAFERAIKLKHKYVEAYNNLGNALNATRQSEKAIPPLEKAIKLNPYCLEAYNNLGNAYNALDKTKKAIKCFERALKLDPNCAVTYNNLGLAYYADNRKKEAVSMLEKAVKLMPNNAAAHNNLATMYCNQKQYGSAIYHCDKAVELGQGVPSLLQKLKPYRK